MTAEKHCAQQADDHDVPLKSHFRRVLAQVLTLCLFRSMFNKFLLKTVEFSSIHFQFLATTVKNMILFDIGLQKAITGIIIPALTGLQNEFNLDEKLSLTPDQTSWLGKEHR